MPKGETFWRGLLAAGTLGDIGSLEWSEAKRQIRDLPASLSDAELKRVVELMQKELDTALWSGLGTISDAHATIILGCIRKSAKLEARMLVAAHGLGGLTGLQQASTLLAEVGKSVHWPGLIKRLQKLKVSPVVAKAADKVLAKPGPAGRLPLWALTFVAARARPGVIDEMAKKRNDDWREAATMVRPSISAKANKKK